MPGLVSDDSDDESADDTEVDGWRAKQSVSLAAELPRGELAASEMATQDKAAEKAARRILCGLTDVV